MFYGRVLFYKRRPFLLKGVHGRVLDVFWTCFEMQKASMKSLKKGQKVAKKGQKRLFLVNFCENGRVSAFLPLFINTREKINKKYINRAKKGVFTSIAIFSNILVCLSSEFYSRLDCVANRVSLSYCAGQECLQKLQALFFFLLRGFANFTCTIIGGKCSCFYFIFFI